MTFALTKIQPPRLRESARVSRPALETRLAQAMLGHRMVLLCAAAGYGKTATLAAALARPHGGLPEGTALAWISADTDDDAPRVVECLAAALEPFDPPWRTAPEALVAALGQPTSAARQAIVAELINTLDACDVPHGVIVVDDLHRVEDEGVFACLDLLLERLTPRWTLAVASRVEPPLALARLRAMGELAEFRQGDLAFDREESRSFAAVLGLDPGSADALHERTRGWPAGLRLAANAARGGMKSGGRLAAADRHVFDFLAAEVLDQLSEELRRFLLRCAVLRELTPAACAAVSGHLQSHRLLEDLERRDLFVAALDDAQTQREPTLRLHDLFREALLHRLQRDHADELPALLRRAADAERDPSRRIDMLLGAGDCEAAARVLLEHAPGMLTEGGLATVRRLLDLFPADFAPLSRHLSHVRGLLGWARWDFVGMLEHMGAAALGYREAGETEAARLAEAYQAIARSPLGRSGESAARLAELRREAGGTEARVVVMVACLWQALDMGSLHRVGPILDELMDRMEGVTDLALWYRAHPIPRCNGLPGTARALDRYVSQVLRLTGDRPSSLRALAFVQRGWREAWQGRLDNAQQSLAQAEDIGRWLGEPPNVQLNTLILSGVLAALRGDRALALARAREFVEGHTRRFGDWALWGQLFYAARIAAACDDATALRAYLDRLTGLQTTGSSVAVQERQLKPLHGHAAWLEGRREEAVQMWRDSLPDEMQVDRLGLSVETRVRLAFGLQQCGRRDEAAEALAPVPAVVAAHAGLGGVLLARSLLPAMAAADWGPALPPALATHLREWAALAATPHAGDAADRSQAATLPAAAHGTAPPDGDGGPPAGVGDAGALSVREVEVLARMAAGDSNKLIARALDLSPHTVKRHVANILDKLAVSSRGQAAAWYRARA